jgi:hypothetical protein
MDLQAAYKMNRKGWSFTKFAAFLCFAVACGLLIGSLKLSPAAKASPALWQTGSVR